MKAFYVYMMTNRSRVVLYIGITNSLVRRVWQHQNGEIEGFTKTYKVNRLVLRALQRSSRRDCAGKGDQGLATREEECIGRDDESEVGGFISDAFSTYASHPERSEGPRIKYAHYANVL